MAKEINAVTLFTTFKKIVSALSTLFTDCWIDGDGMVYGESIDKGVLRIAKIKNDYIPSWYNHIAIFPNSLSHDISKMKTKTLSINEVMDNGPRLVFSSTVTSDDESKTESVCTADTPILHSNPFTKVYENVDLNTINTMNMIDIDEMTVTDLISNPILYKTITGHYVVLGKSLFPKIQSLEGNLSYGIIDSNRECQTMLFKYDLPTITVYEFLRSFNCD